MCWSIEGVDQNLTNQNVFRSWGQGVPYHSSQFTTSKIVHTWSGALAGAHWTRCVVDASGRTHTGRSGDLISLMTLTLDLLAVAADFFPLPGDLLALPVVHLFEVTLCVTGAVTSEVMCVKLQSHSWPKNICIEVHFWSAGGEQVAVNSCNRSEPAAT